jgi:hypothetical protein
VRLLFVPVVPPDFFTALLGIEALHADAGTEAFVAPAMFGIE